MAFPGTVRNDDSRYSDAVLFSDLCFFDLCGNLGMRNAEAQVGFYAAIYRRHVGRTCGKLPDLARYAGGYF